MTDEPTGHPAGLFDDELVGQCDVERLRRSGPGGQHRNKVETAVRLTHRPTGVRAEASERRRQGENLRVAVARLRMNLALEVRRPFDLAGPPSPLWRSRCPGGRLAISPSHPDLPALVAESLDALAAAEGDTQRAATALGTTPSQLVKLLRKEPRSLALLNRWRAERGLSRLR